MKRINSLWTAVLCLAALALSLMISCGKTGGKEDNKHVVIYTSTEDFRTEHMQELLKAKFPDYDIVVEVLSTGNHAAKIKAEGTSTEADIIINLETSYVEALQEYLADLSSFDLSPFLPELVPASKKYVPWDKSSGAIVINRKKITEMGLPVPATYQDLLKPVYKGLISMPNPKSSGTGYMFYASLVIAWGEEAALDYFDKLAENILQFTTSGSGPVNALIQEEAAVGLGMTITATSAINTKSVPLEMFFFKEGAPVNTTSMGIIKGREERPIVREVFEFAMTTLNREDKELYCPEAIYKDQSNNIPNYPRNIPYADMTGAFNQDFKERLLDKWKY